MAVQSFNAWSAAVTGFKYLPYSLVGQAVTVAGAIAIGQVASWGTVKELLFPSDSRMCNAVKDASLLQKAALFLGVGQTVGISTGEEVMIRGILQDGLLTRLPKAVLGIFGRNHWVDSRPAQVVRVGISAAAFAAMHLANAMILPLEALKFQIANTLGLGIAAAVVKERTGSVVAAMGLHGLYNAIALPIPNLWLATNACSIFKSDPTPTSFSSSTPEQSISLDQNTCPVESIFTYPTCSSKNNALAEKAEHYKDMAEYFKEKQEEYKEKTESLLQLAQNPYPVESE